MGKKVELHKGNRFDLLRHAHSFKSKPLLPKKTKNEDAMKNCWRAAIFLGQERARARNPIFLTHLAMDMAFTFQL